MTDLHALSAEELAEKVQRFWDATSNDSAPATFLLCEDIGEIAGNGNCPVHGGDACLFVYAKALLLDPQRNPPLAELVRRAAATRCEFGCGPDPDDGSHVGGPGYGIVPACPVHGWVCELLDSRAAEARVAEATNLLERANHAVTFRGCLHLVRAALHALAGSEDS